MLVEISSPAFIKNGEKRPPVIFQQGLNVVLGMDDGENSIGKSSFLLAIDFVFGGKTYLSSDGVKHIGDHTIFFTFEFDGNRYSFARSTAEGEKVFLCNAAGEQTDESWTRQAFVEWLTRMYGINNAGFSFRTSVGTFFRIYGKKNTDEQAPLRGYPGQSMQSSIDSLIKLFDRYGEIEQYSNKLETEKARLAAFRDARKYHFISSIVGGREQLEANEKRIDELEAELALLTESQTEVHSEEDIERSRKKTDLLSKKIKLEAALQSMQRRRSLLTLSLEYGLYPTEADLEELQSFFPTVNLKKIYEVEKYHRKLAAILDGQFAAERDELSQQIADLQEQINVVQAEIRALGVSVQVSKEFLDRHSEIKSQISALRDQNEAFQTQQDLEEARNKANEQLKRSIEAVLADISATLNQRMKGFNDTLYHEARKAPRITFSGFNSYHFETPDDMGTGTNYKGLVLFDLSVLFETKLPAIAHDSLILKNIGDKSIDGIMALYQSSKKQIFIAFDKSGSYEKKTQETINAHTVLTLENHGAELYGQSWNVEENP